MKIARIDSHSIKVPYTFGGSHQGEGLRTWTTNNILLVRVETDTGIVGWGEAFCYACTDAVRAALHNMVAPLALGQDARDIARLSYDLQQKLHLFGRYGITIFALSGLDIALWDIAGKAANLPLHRLLGGAGRDKLPPDETNGNTPLVSAQEVAWYSWKTTGDPRLPDMIAGGEPKNMVDLCYQTLALAEIDKAKYAAQIKANAVKAYATLGRERGPGLENIPTAEELGVKGLDCGAWGSFSFPKDTPKEIVDRLAKASSDAIDTPAVIERFKAVGVVVTANDRRSPEFLTSFVKSELARWVKPIQASGVSLD